MPKPSSGKRRKNLMSNSSSGRIKTTKPPGIMSEYHIEDFGRRLEIHFDNNFVRGESVLVTLPNKASAAARTRAINNAINQHRPDLELAASSRRNGFATFVMSQKWGGRLLSDAEKNQVNQEIEQHIKQLFKSPFSKKGRELNEGYWKKETGGWRRIT